MDPRLHGFKLEDPLPVFHRVIARDAEKLITEQGKALGIVRRHPLFTSGAIFPEMDDERLIDRDLAGIAAVQSGVVIGTRHTHVDILIPAVKTSGPPDFPF